MPNTFLVSIVAWVILTAGVIALAVYRNVLARNEDDILHVRESEMALVPQQEALAKRLELLDHWGKVLTVAALSYGLLLAALFLYHAWQTGPTM